MDLTIVRQEAHTPVGGRLQLFSQNWKQISKDPWILETITGCKLEFTSIPQQTQFLPQFTLDKQKSQVLGEELGKMAAKQAIERVSDPAEACFISPMFLVAKSDGSWRPVINLKSLNRHTIARHFKMESIRTVKGLLQEGDYMMKLDLKDAYLSVPLCPLHRKFVAFHWGDQLWRFKTLPFGLNSAPYVFTKLTKPIVAVLRKLGIRVILYLDDMLILATTQERARKHLAAALELLVALGFVVNTKKSMTDPTQSLEFLGFVLDSKRMRISLPTEKLKSIRKLAEGICQRPYCSVRQMAQLIGMMVAAHPAVLPAPLHYRCLERARIQALRHSQDYESQVQVTQTVQKELTWWIREAAQHNGRSLHITQWDLTIETDASTKGWGAVYQEMTTGGAWTAVERRSHINYLELSAAFLALKTFLKDKRGVTVLLRMDNVTSIAFINRMGGTHSTALSDLAVAIWKWCLEREITIHAEHLPGKLNVRADWESRHAVWRYLPPNPPPDSSNWMLRRDVFLQLEEIWGPFSIDLFASRTNAQLPAYCSWRPDPSAQTVDALSIPWGDHLAYMFPPFSLIMRCLEKTRSEQATAALIAPVWQNQLWYPFLLRSLIDLPILLPPVHDILLNPEGQTHPLVGQGHLPLAAWLISGDPSALMDFQTELSSSFGSHGATPRSQHTLQHGDCGTAGALDGVSIPFRHL